jgi:hypothetical protein
VGKGVRWRVVRYVWMRWVLTLGQGPCGGVSGESLGWV